MAFYEDAAAALADGCLHYWPFDEESGVDFFDQVGNFHGAVYTTDFTGPDPDVSIVDGLFGKGRDPFAYGSATVQEVLGLELDVSNQTPATTFSAWSFRVRFYFRSNIYGEAFVCLLGQNGIGNQNFNIWLNGNVAEVWTSADGITTDSALTQNAWHEIIVTYDGTTITYYRNGAVIGSYADPNPLPLYHGGYKHIFSRWPSGSSFDFQDTPDGIIDEACFWNRALSAGEVATLYNGGSFQSLLGGAVVAATPLPAVREVATYKAILTGAPDSLTDLEIPISSFNARLRSARNSFLSLVAPNCAVLVDAIEARPNGELVVYQTLNGSDTELARANFQDIRLDKGPTAGTTATLSGYKQKTYDTPGNYSITTESYYSRSGGKSRARCQLLKDITPADTVTVSGVSFVVDTVVLIGSPRRVYMEIAE